MTPLLLLTLGTAMPGLHAGVRLTAVSLPAAPQTSLMPRVVPHPTGVNGYEDFVRGAEMLANSGAQPLLTYAPGAVQGLKGDLEFLNDALARARERSAKSEVHELEEQIRWTKERMALLEKYEGWPLLAVQREAVERGRTAWSVFLGGLAKPVSYPGDPANPGQLMPELSYFRNMSRYASCRARVEMADGRPLDACRTLASSIEASLRYSSGSMIHSLVARSGVLSVTSLVSRHASELPEAGLPLLDAPFEAALNRTSEMAEILKIERRSCEEIRQKIQDKSATAKDFEDYAFAAAGYEEVKNRPRAEMVRLLASSLDSTESLISAYDEILARPEEEWLRSKPKISFEIPSSDPVDGWDSFWPLLVAYERSRTQFRILRAALAVWRHRAHTGRLPEALSEAAGPQLRRDPISGGTLQYRRDESGGFRIWSTGCEETGEIDLIYRRPQKSDPREPP